MSTDIIRNYHVAFFARPVKQGKRGGKLSRLDYGSKVVAAFSTSVAAKSLYEAERIGWIRVRKALEAGQLGKWKMENISDCKVRVFHPILGN